MFDLDYFKKILKEMMSIDSPSGFSDNIAKKIEEYALELGYPFSRNQKGNMMIEVPGLDERTVGICAHVDTLGAMVRSIKDNGHLAFTPIGSPVLASIDSELCRIHSRDGKVYTGTFFSNHPSKHVYKQASQEVRQEETMEVILDEIVHNKEDVLKLGINNGDYICFDSKTVIAESGFIKSRFLDDKLSVAIIFTVLKYLKEKDIKPSHHLKVLISTYEEVGHGMSAIPQDIQELLAIDMGCIGDDLQCSEYQVSICAKDSSGPYDYHMVNGLIDLAKKYDIDYAVDIYPMYGSDVSAALRGGNDIKGALIGAGVFASHGYERTHQKAVLATMNLLMRYLTK